MNKPLFAGIVALVAIATAPSFAQAPKPVRGTIEKIDGPVVAIKEKDGTVVPVKLTDNAQVFGVVPATVADISIKIGMAARGPT